MKLKTVHKNLRLLAAELPLIFKSSHETHLVTGQELLDDGIFDINGEKIDPEGKYEQNLPVVIAFNHFRKLKRLYKKFGMEGVTQYTAQCFAAEDLKNQ